MIELYAGYGTGMSTTLALKASCDKRGCKETVEINIKGRLKLKTADTNNFCLELKGEDAESLKQLLKNDGFEFNNDYGLLCPECMHLYRMALDEEYARCFRDEQKADEDADLVD